MKRGKGDGKENLEWYALLPEHMKPTNEKLEELEQFRQEWGFPHKMMFMAIALSPWAVRRVQEVCLEQNKRLLPNANEKELWRSVIISRFHVKLLVPAFSDQVTLAPWMKPLPKEELLSRIERIDSIVATFKSFDDVVQYIISLDREEGAFHDPSGMQDELNALLEA